MHILYMDESGNPSATDPSTNHFVLLGFAIPITKWAGYSEKISEIKKRHQLRGVEIHTAWIAKRYREQEQITNFEDYNFDDRRRLVEAKRDQRLARVGRTQGRRKNRLKNDFNKSAQYIHLTRAERLAFLSAIGDFISNLTDAKLFADAIQMSKYAYTHTAFQEAFEQVVSRFQTYLTNRSNVDGIDHQGLIVQDQNTNEATGLTKLMRSFYKNGTKWREIDKIVETPFFVDSKITEMVQLADFCAYATRRHFDFNDSELFNKIYDRFDKLPDGKLVGLRHFTGNHRCTCAVCLAHGRYIA